METIVLEYSDVRSYPDLCDFIDYLFSDGQGDDVIENALEMFDNDPDLIRINGETSRFIDVDVNGVKYVLYTEELNGIEEVLLNFFSEKYKEIFTREESDWKVYSAVDNAIAYRGGEGYSYSIYSF